MGVKQGIQCDVMLCQEKRRSASAESYCAQLGTLAEEEGVVLVDLALDTVTVGKGSAFSRPNLRGGP